MFRINTPADVANTGRVHIDTGEGVALDLPTVVFIPPVPYYSGLRDISGELLDGWTGTLFVEREGANVYFRGTINGSAATSDVPWMLPTGLRPGFIRSGVGQTDYGGGIAWSSEATPKMYRINHYLNRFQVTGATGQTANVTINHSLRTRETPPTNPPGDPA